MCNLINSLYHLQKVLNCLFNQDGKGSIDLHFTSTSGKVQTANEQLSSGFLIGKVISYPLQNPIKNIICYPE